MLSREHGPSASPNQEPLNKIKPLDQGLQGGEEPFGATFSRSPDLQLTGA